jgi:hypothetical protein
MAVLQAAILTSSTFEPNPASVGAPLNITFIPHNREPFQDAMSSPPNGGMVQNSVRSLLLLHACHVPHPIIMAAPGWYDSDPQHSWVSSSSRWRATEYKASFARSRTRSSYNELAIEYRHDSELG